MKRELDRSFDELRGLLVDHGATIEKYIGDAIFAMFGVQTAHPDDAERALRAARACADRAQQDGRLLGLHEMPRGAPAAFVGRARELGSLVDGSAVITRLTSSPNGAIPVIGAMVPMSRARCTS